MKRIRYTKFTGELAGEMDLEDLMQQLSDYLLDSGFQDPMMRFQELNGEHTLENLREALRQALEAGNFEQHIRERLDQMAAEGELEQLIDQLIDRMEQQDYIRIDQPGDPSRMSTTPGSAGEGETQARFEVTDKSLDFLGYKTLQDLLGSLGRSSAGRHDTFHQATGVETNGSTRQYEFGDTMNLDANATLAAAITAQAERFIGDDGEAADGIWPIEVDYPHLHVQQSDYQSSCATVVMLDCSHSMILYGAVALDPHTVSGRHAEPGAVSRLGRGSAGFADRAGEGRAALHEYARGIAAGAVDPEPAAQGDAADCDDHRRQAVGADAAGWTDLQERVWAGPAGAV